jgi:ATP-binding cassette subfamily B protein
MWGLSAVSEEDRLDRVQTLKVLRRAYSMARSQRRLILSSLAFVLIGTLVTLAGPTLVRFAIDHGIKVKDGSALNRVVVLYVIVTVIGYLSGRLQYITINRAGEGFLRELRINVFDKLQKQSTNYFFSINTTAYAVTPSSRPIKLSSSVVVAFIDTASG